MFVKNESLLQVMDKNFVNFSIRVCHSNHNSMTDEIDTNLHNNHRLDENNSSQSEWTEDIDFRNQLSSNERRVPKTYGEYRLQQRVDVNQPPMPRLVRVAVIGSPNAGKSTLTNQLVGRKVSSVSTKVHTTRHKVIGIIVADETQVELLDTPGVVTSRHCAKHQLESTFMSDPLTGAEAADVIAVINDASNIRERHRLNAGIIKLLERHPNKESVLILNKIDKIKEKRKLLDITTELTCGVVGGISSIKTKNIVIPDSKKGLESLFERTEQKVNSNYSSKVENTDNDEDVEEKIGWNRFSRVFMTSALTGDGIEDIRQYFLSIARFHPWIYHRSQVTDQNPHELVRNTLREKFLDLLREEIPYKIHFAVTMWHVDQLGNLFISVDVLCPHKFQSLVIGPKGQTIATVVNACKESLQNTFYCDVSLKLIVKPIKNK
jgi:GTP-binding protein Era